ncbi:MULTISPECIES: hypothetical protein [Pseudoalteromonas]|uniref:hypothetical protein n=1 Tax=Pseudoalteromonas TaxID=53246 RepID=UPI0015834FA2|nr:MULTISPECIES: hypothetical protein [Pseudoalteromonas]MDI4652647.1 hypothetical protein [Pseudoalteromonas shioyasakiensis]NUJ38643.1 hypothetical protein [Pseudoalteromonas sp. 0303]
MELDVDFTNLHLAAAKMRGIEPNAEQFICFARTVIDGMDKELTAYLELSFNQVVSGENVKAGSDFNRLIKDYIAQVCQ